MHSHSRSRMSTIALLMAFACQLAMAQEPQWWTNQKRDCNLAPSLAYETWRQQGSPCNGDATSENNQEQQRQRELELERQREELERQRELQRQQQAEAERKRNAGEADQKGLAAQNRGDLKGAANWFIEALRFAPESAEIRAHLDQANVALADAGSAAEILKLRQQIEDSIEASKIEALRQNIEDERTAERLNRMAEDFRVPPGRRYRPSGNAFIGGTGWIAGYNVQSANPAVIAQERAMLKKQMELAGQNYAEAVDFNRYNFVLGIGASTTIFFDLKNRVIFDEFTNGQFSAGAQSLYDSLKDRRFGELACHSTGAMVCLAALKNQDVRAEHVVLYGPQITRESLQMWNELLQTHQVKSVQIYINQNDPVPPFSLALGDLFENLTAQAALLNSGVLKTVINEISPRIAVQTFSCGGGYPTPACHGMTVYKKNRGCTPQPKGRPVPGTSRPGKVGVAEPPPPC